MFKITMTKVSMTTAQRLVTMETARVPGLGGCGERWFHVSPFVIYTQKSWRWQSILGQCRGDTTTHQLMFFFFLQEKVNKHQINEYTQRRACQSIAGSPEMTLHSASLFMMMLSMASNQAAAWRPKTSSCLTDLSSWVSAAAGF